MSASLLRWTRRLHLYLGLGLLPWVLLYAVTAFLFNHPGVFSDAPLISFDRESCRGTSLEQPLDPGQLAREVVRALNSRRPPNPPYEVLPSPPPRFNREFAFATVAAPDQAINVLVDVAHGGGTIRVAPAPARPPAERAPFAIDPAGRKNLPPASAGPGSRAPEPARKPDREQDAGLVLENTLHRRMEQAIPTLLDRLGIPGGKVTVTSVPDLVFRMQAGEEPWTVTFNALTGSVTGQREIVAPPPMSVRRFLLRLHTAHGYPGEVGVPWVWAAIVDVTAAVLVFWCASGLVMWWQIRVTRLPGLLVLVLSGSAAAWTALGMWAAWT
jgi:hypothetical protein